MPDRASRYRGHRCELLHLRALINDELNDFRTVRSSICRPHFASAATLSSRARLAPTIMMILRVILSPNWTPLTNAHFNLNFLLLVEVSREEQVRKPRPHYPVVHQIQQGV